MTQKLQALSATKTFQPLEPVADIDVKSFLKNEYENGILSVITLNQKQSALNIRSTTWNHSKKVWLLEKNKITNSLLGPSSKRSNLDLVVQSEESFIHDVPSVKSMLNQQEIAYAKEVNEYNKAIMTGLTQPNLLDNFYNVAKTFNDKVRRY